MEGLTRAYGRPMTGLLLALLAVWIVGMIAAPLGAMIERSFVFVDRDDELTRTGTALNRVTRDIATIDLDIRILEGEAERLAADEAPAPSASGGLLVPGVTVPSADNRPAPPSPGLLVPGISFPSADNRPNVPSPSLPSPGLVPSLGGGAPAERTVEAVEAEIASLRERRGGLETRLATLRETEERLRIEKADAPRYSLANFSTISALHLRVFGMTLLYACAVTLIAFAVTYPVAYAAATARSAERAAFLLLLLIVPYAINEILRTYAWAMILAREGPLNDLLGRLGLVGADAPQWVASNNSVFLVMVYAYVLFMAFPLINVLGTLDRNQIESARDLGASTWRLHARVVVPHAKPGIAMGAIMVFMLSAGSFAVPEIIGRGLHPDWFTQIIYRRFFESANWNQGAAYSLMLLGACIAFILLVLTAFRVSIWEIAK